VDAQLDGNWGVAIVLTTPLAQAPLPAPLAHRVALGEEDAEDPARDEGHPGEVQGQPPEAAGGDDGALQEAQGEPARRLHPDADPAAVLLRLLRDAPERVRARFAHFLWAHDLSAPDTVYTFTAPVIGSLNVNILPLIVVATIAIQMRMTPQPTVDNAQMKMMKFMPFFMLLIYYSYSCALSLYSTVNSLFTIGQQLVINRMKDVEDVPPPGKGRPTKNVTPKRAADRRPAPRRAS
jgi:hypothetical protein